jgi:hypothetical protein
MSLFNWELEFNRTIAGILGVQRHTGLRPHARLVLTLKIAAMLNQVMRLSR